MSSLSAAAIPFSPAAPPPDTSSNEYFAQTGAAQDDLFDGFTPIDNSMRVRSDDDLFSEDFIPVQQPVVETQTSPRGRGRGEGGRSRGRGRGRGARDRGDAASNTPTRGSAHTEQAQAQAGGDAPESAPKGPRQEGVASVRGNRQATGGLAKPKLTEAELAEKMEKIKIKNASLTAAHARAQADEASFAEREEQAKQVAARRQKEERRDRQQMMGERERNRMRKLKAMEGREWDAEKNEDDFQRGGKFDKKGSFAGDKEDYTDGREYLYREGRATGRGLGRGGRGGKSQEQRAPAKEDFPALAPSKAPAAPAVDLMNPADRAAVKSWADQVESSNAE